jgi:hypothetical protein
MKLFQIIDLVKGSPAEAVMLAEGIREALGEKADTYDVDIELSNIASGEHAGKPQIKVTWEDPEAGKGERSVALRSILQGVMEAYKLSRTAKIAEEKKASNG